MKDLGREIPSLGFEGECWYGAGLYECRPHEALCCFVERALPHNERAAGRPYSVLMYNYNSVAIMKSHYANDLFEAKMIIQAEIDAITSGGK